MYVCIRFNLTRQIRCAVSSRCELRRAVERTRKMREDSMNTDSFFKKRRVPCRLHVEGSATCPTLPTNDRRDERDENERHERVPRRRRARRARPELERRLLAGGRLVVVAARGSLARRALARRVDGRLPAAAARARREVDQGESLLSPSPPSARGARILARRDRVVVAWTIGRVSPSRTSLERLRFQTLPISDVSVSLLRRPPREPTDRPIDRRHDRSIDRALARDVGPRHQLLHLAAAARGRRVRARLLDRGREQRRLPRREDCARLRRRHVRHRGEVEKRGGARGRRSRCLARSRRGKRVAACEAFSRVPCCARGAREASRGPHARRGVRHAARQPLARQRHISITTTRWWRDMSARAHAGVRTRTA